MPISTNDKKVSIAEKASAIVDNNVGNYEKHPFFIKKANKAKAIIDRVGLPEKKVKSD